MKLVLASVTITAVPIFADSYTFTTINVPGANSTTATGVNASGEIVGNFTDATGMHGFIDLNGSFTTVNSPSSPTYTQLWGINNAGQIVGNIASSGFIYSNGTFTPVDPPPSTPFIEYDDVVPYGINNSGQLVGNLSEVLNGLVGRGPFGFVDTAGTFSLISGPNGYTFPQGINNNGLIVGYSYTNPEFVGVDGFVDNNGSGSVLDVAGAFGTQAFAVNDAGQVVGFYYGSIFGPNNQDNGFIEQNGVFSTVNVPGATATQIFGINDAGDLVGSYSDSDGTHAFLATPSAVPEPVSLALLGIGLAGLAVIRRYRC